MSKFDFCQVFPLTVLFYKGYLGWENIEKFSLEGTSLQSSCLRTQLIFVLK